MSGTQSTVRMGPISVLTLAIVLCLAVMGVLAITTAQATYTAAEKQALFTTDTYANEQEAQNLVSQVDAALAPVRAAGGGLDAAVAAVGQALPRTATLDGSTVRATFAAESGRTLEVELVIRDNATYEIARWKATTQWTDAGARDVLWSGAKQTG